MTPTQHVARQPREYEEDNFLLDTTSLSSLDLSRFLMQNLSNQNLEGLLDFDPPGDCLNLTQKQESQEHSRISSGHNASLEGVN